MAASFVSLLDKLKSPHRSVQRHAVRAIFESLRSNSSQDTFGHHHHHLLLHSPAGKQALSDCLLLSSRSAPALDEAISQLCYLALGQKSPSSADNEDDGEPILALFHLQALLECSPPEAVPSIVRCIVFVCRFLIAKRWSVLQGLLSHELHPLIKAFESRQESHLEIIQQVIVMLTQNDLTKKDTECLHFLEPLLNYLAVNSTLSNERYLVIRELCFNIASLVSSNFATGRFLVRLLLCFNSQQTQDAERMVIGLREMVDAVESWVRQACSKEEIGDCKRVVGDILSLLVDSCLNLNKSGISPLPILQLLGRIVRLQKHLDDSFAWCRNVLSLAYLLALTDVTEEQLTLICLARDVLRKTNKTASGVDLLIASIDTFPFALLWIYPTVNIMSSSYSPLKEAATNLLHDLEDLLVLYWTQNESSTSPQTQDCCSLHSHGQLADNIHRILLHIWFNDKPWETWISLKDDLGWIDVNNRKSKSWLHSLSRFFGEIFQNYYSNAQKSKRKSGVISWICMMMSVVLIHPVMTIVASEVFAEIVKTDRTEGVSLLPVLLFYLRAWKRNQRKLKATNLFGLLKVLPILAVDPMSTSIVVGTLQSLLSSECSGVLQSTAIRLLCKTWEMSDKVFPQIQTALVHSYFSEDTTDIQIHLSRAASICDICKKDGDSGVELILSVQACIESEQIPIKALGLQSLSWLCHHDVIDFYTAWDFLSDLFRELPSDPLLAESILWFFQNGALDAAAYSETSQTILQLLWKATQIQDVGGTTVRASALKSLCQYEVDLLDASLGDHRASYVKILLSEKEPEVIRASQSLIIKFLHHENKFRYRDQNRRKHVDNKTEKIIHSIPRVLFAADDHQGLLIQSAPAYLLLKFDQSPSPVDFQTKKKLQAWENEFEREFCEIADQLNCESNLIYALLYLDLWIPFIKYHINRRRGLNTMSDIASNVRETPFHLMKILCRISEQAIPRVAENAVLVLGILYQISHTIPDSLIVPAVSYLKGHLMQQSHEYLQWTSAISLGIITRNCSGSEWRLKMEISNCLLQCLSSSDRDLVRGACGIGLGFVDQNIMSQDLHESGALDSDGTVKDKEFMIHYQIVKNILNLFSVWFPNLFVKWEKLGLPVGLECSGYGEGLYFPEIKSFSSEDNECIWTASGLCIALACTVISWERIGDLNSVSHIVEVMVDGIHAIIREDDQECSRLFAVGAFLSLPTFVEPCLRLGISTDKVEGVFGDVKHFMKVCLQNNNIPDELKMAACIGSGNFIATLLQDGTFKLCLEDINLVIAAMKGISLEKNCGLATLGAFIGLSNILHGGAGHVSPLRHRRMDILKHLSEALEDAESTVCIPLLYSNSCKVIVQELLQHLLNVFLQEVKPSLKSYAGWALALIRKISMEKKNLEHDDISDTNHMNPYKLTLGNLPKDSTLYILSSLLLDIRNTHVDTTYPYATAISILRCLKEAPQLPYLDWGTVMRQMLQQMKALGSVDKEHAHIMQDELCKECILFALAHARKLSNLQIFLDEICDLSRLISVQKTVSGVLMLHIADLSAIFSRHRLEKFFNDTASFICRHRNIDPGLSEDSEINFWKGFKGLLTRIDKEGSEINQDSFFVASEKCIELLDSPLNTRNTNLASMKWKEALECMSLASTAWIVKVAQFDWKARPMAKKDEISAVKAVYILSQLVARCRLTPPTLWKPLRWLCQQESSSDTFRQLLWVTSSLDKMPQKEREEFLIEAIETTCSFTDPELGLLFIALLASSWCSFAPVIILDSQKILELMPFTLPSLLSEENWRFSAKPILWKLVVLLDKFHSGSRKPGSGLYYIKRVCIAMSEDLPLVDRLKLSDCF